MRLRLITRPEWRILVSSALREGSVSCALKLASVSLNVHAEAGRTGLAQTSEHAHISAGKNEIKDAKQAEIRRFRHDFATKTTGLKDCQCAKMCMRGAREPAEEGRNLVPHGARQSAITSG